MGIHIVLLRIQAGKILIRLLLQKQSDLGLHCSSRPVWQVTGVQNFRTSTVRESSGSVVECWTRDRRAAGLSLTGVTALWSLSKTHLS